MITDTAYPWSGVRNPNEIPRLLGGLPTPMATMACALAIELLVRDPALERFPERFREALTERAERATDPAELERLRGLAHVVRRERLDDSALVDVAEKLLELRQRAAQLDLIRALFLDAELNREPLEIEGARSTRGRPGVRRGAEAQR
jgi:hypothetical protein